jgi:ABC-type transport system involved in cytochrome c biogenesis permease subunit
VAVLDTNLWLWTHVICVTLGYTAAFVAGIVAVVYILLGVFTKVLADDDTRKSLARMTYGILCFAMIFSFVGTILGGIWADQSWGRFWGWDPKENGAVLIVLWTALVLHARWCGWARERGIAALAVFGNVVTAWSWFGTNMLGVGLHSYGFMDRALAWLLAFVCSQLIIIAIGSIPTQLWRSYSGGGKPPVARGMGKLMTA